MRIRRLIAAVCFFPFAGCGTAQMEQGTIFTGTVVVGEEQTPRAGYAVYVHDGLIRDVGPAAAVTAAHRGARLVETGGTILPGLVDAHAHLYGLGLALDTVSLTGTRSLDEVVQRVRDRLATAAPDEWILGRGWDQNQWPVQEFPTAAPLDAAVGDRPVWLRRVDGHAALASSAAMRAAGITAATPDPPGGRILRDAEGKPTGVFIDAAMALVERIVPPVSFEQRKRHVLASAQRIARNGLTAIHDAGADGETIRAVRELIDEGRFPIRVYVMLGDNEALLREWFARGPLLDYGGRLTVRSVKLYADGALGSRGAALLEPYSDDPGNRGLMIASTGHMTDVARRARAAGFQVNTHAIGDAGVRNVLDAYEAAGVQQQDRFRIEHLQVVAPSDFARLARRGVIASMQPTHATSDMYWAEARLGPERVRGAYAWRTVLDSGGRLALGSDFPVEEVNPWLGIYAAVTRRDQKGWPEKGWYPGQRLTLAEAIRGFTRDAAFAAFEETRSGSIEPGKLADLTIVEENPYAVSPDALDEVRVKYTVVGGEIVYLAAGAGR
ncbi:MAG TPA: amidohydrolase [Thermoanaerobaculia bacterium]|nr:amidohydrolase [Thermoanaerobaculia bacterium]